MENISKVSSIKQASLKEVDVLLATFNGDNYLTDFLDSLLSQVGVKIRLYVSDDGSTDQTRNILDSYSTRFDSYVLMSGPGHGPSANFNFLLSQSKGEFVALADQDDLWLPNHLIDSITRLSKPELALIPALSICKVLEFFDNDSKTIVWPDSDLIIDFPHVFYENFGRGCTMVLNRNLVNLAIKVRSECSIMHDWWILLLAHAYGTVISTNAIEVQYRIHSANFVGNPKRSPRNLLRSALKSRLGAPRHNQIDCLLSKIQSSTEVAIRIKEITAWSHILHAPHRKRLTLLNPNLILRDKFVENLLTKFSLIFFICHPSKIFHKHKEFFS